MIMNALNRTCLLMRTDLMDGIEDEVLLDALRSTRVVLAADEAALSTHSGQSAYITAATLMARSGHSVWLAAPEVKLIGAQPPLRGEKLVAGLRDLGEDLLPRWSFEDGPPPGKADLTLAFERAGKVTISATPRAPGDTIESNERRTPHDPASECSTWLKRNPHRSRT